MSFRLWFSQVPNIDRFLFVQLWCYFNSRIFLQHCILSFSVASIVLCSTWQFVFRWSNQLDEVAMFRVSSLFCFFHLNAKRTISLFVLSTECIKLSLWKYPNNIVPYFNLHVIFKKTSSSGKNWNILFTCSLYTVQFFLRYFRMNQNSIVAPLKCYGYSTPLWVSDSCKQ